MRGTQPIPSATSHASCRSASRGTVLYYDPSQGLNQQLAPNGNALSTAVGHKNTLTVLTQNHTVESDSTEGVLAGRVWPKWVRMVRPGSLVAAILKGNGQGELYHFDPADGTPTPLVAVVSTGNDWMMWIIREMGSMYAGLGDKFGLPDQMILSQRFSRDKNPPDSIAPFPNLIAFTDEEKARILSGELPLKCSATFRSRCGWTTRRRSPSSQRKATSPAPCAAAWRNTWLRRHR